MDTYKCIISPYRPCIIKVIQNNNFYAPIEVNYNFYAQSIIEYYHR